MYVYIYSNNLYFNMCLTANMSVCVCVCVYTPKVITKEFNLN